MFSVYVLQNDLKKIYIGHTSDITTRIQQHNALLPSSKKSFTHKQRAGTWKIVYTEECASRAEAIKREKQLKSYRGRMFIHTIIAGMGR